MPDRYPPVNPKCPHFLHGGDYNPDQWDRPTWLEDMRLMKLSGCNAMSVGIFSWAHIEVDDGRYEFGWLDEVMDMLAANGAYAVLATPSASHPAWMSAKYPEVLRVGADLRRRHHGNRVNYCLTSPIFRRKAGQIAEKLAQRYKDHPALLMWHMSNEYGGECHCELCQQAFRDWLRKRYGSIAALNAAWWAAFWGHTFGDFSQIESPHQLGERCMQGQMLDWRRFVSDQTLSLMLDEIAPLRRITPAVPITTNAMGTYTGLNYWQWAPHQDVVSWDSYAQWRDDDDDWKLAAGVSFTHDIYRAFKGGKPHLLMESTPSVTNWQPVAKLKRPGVHRLGSLQAVAHGADSVQYFQWRKSRGGAEKYHGAVVDHCGHENNRVFGDVAEVGEILAKLDDVIGATVRPQVAVVYDWENRWAIDAAAGPRKERKDYLETCKRHYVPFWSAGVSVDVIDQTVSLDGYKLVIAPMSYLLRPGFAERVEKFVQGGGTFVTTYWTGIVNETDIVFTGGWPGPLRKLLGVWVEEMDVLHDGERNTVVPAPQNALGLSADYKAEVFCDLLHAESAEVLATYGEQFYAGWPALTVNRFGSGRAYYIASRNEDAMLTAFYGRLIQELGLKRVMKADLPEGVTAQLRGDGKRQFVFLLNFKRCGWRIDLAGEKFTDLLSGQAVEGAVDLAGCGSMVLEKR